jgi:predicted GH43/DUF377 family glycosyl hydrolase
MKNLLKALLLTIVLALGIDAANGQRVWTKDARNPVFSGASLTWSANVFCPCVLFNSDSARYEMWFSATPGLRSDPTWRPYSVGFAVSNDGINWSMYPSPVLSPDSGKWDSFTTDAPQVLRENGQYKMWYSSYKGGTSPGYFGYATSPDGIHWTKYSGNPIFGPGTAAWEAAGPYSCNVVPKQGGYRMWYDGYNLSITTWKIGYAESSDGVNWIRDTVNNPVLDVGSPGQWDAVGVGKPSVVGIGDSLYMWYFGSNGGSTGLAVSKDGRTNWTKCPYPVLVSGASGGNWDAVNTCVGTVLRVEDTLHMWYGHATAPVVISAVAEGKGYIPGAFLLAQNYPNPFNPSTTIKYELPKASHVSLTVYDVLGRQVSVLVNEKKDAGVHEVKFDGSELASGVYFYRIQAGDYVATKKLVLMK